MNHDFISELQSLKQSVEGSIDLMLANYRVANPATFWIIVDIVDDDPRSGTASDEPDFFKAIEEYMDAIKYVGEGGPNTNARLVAALTNGQEIILHQVGDFSGPGEQRLPSHPLGDELR